MVTGRTVEDRMAKAVRIVVSIQDPSRFEQVLDAAAALGFRAEQKFPELGVATGSLAEDAIPALARLEGIGAVERDRSYRALG
jgi:TolB-like protein